MARYVQKVVETRTILVDYEVEAPDAETAADKVRNGDTVDETPHPHTVEVVERTPHGDLEPVEDER